MCAYKAYKSNFDPTANPISRHIDNRSYSNNEGQGESLWRNLHPYLWLTILTVCA